MKTAYFMFFILAANILLFSQTQEINYSTPYSTAAMDLTQRGGKYITASGDLKVLVVFAKFKGDTSSHQYWPVDSYPTEMNEFIDSSINVGSTHFLNLTNYYKQMSFGKFNVTGKVIGVESPYPIDHYKPNIHFPLNMGMATKDILQTIDDSIDYKEFDNWTYLSDYNFINQPDGIVDMIILIWRGLIFSDQWNGVWHLGGGSEFLVENNQVKIRRSYGGNPVYGIDGSGITVQYWGDRSRESNLKVVIHEMAHWLIQDEHPYNYYIHTFWGMLTRTCDGICANSFEREKLGWLNPLIIDDSVVVADMGDYITTPSAYKYHLRNGLPDEHYYFENHQKLSIYDDATSNTNDRGIFIMHISSNYNNSDCVRLLTSDGFWDWDSPGHSDCWGNDLPAFRKKSVNRNGLGNRDKIKIDNTYCGFIYSYINDQGEAECNGWLHGYGFKNSFDTTFNDVFSPWSNPPAKTCNYQLTDFSMEILNQIGPSISVKFTTNNALGCKPSKPPIGINPIKSDDENNLRIISLVWGADNWDKSPIEPDINWSELQMRIDSSDWETIYSGTDRFWSDSNYAYSKIGDISVSFRARVRDNQNKWSIWSNVYETIKTNNNLTSLGDKNENHLTEYYLSQNYPNPFNPVTKIRYRIPLSPPLLKGESEAGGFVSLKVYDILGNEIATLINKEQLPGEYEFEFNAANLPSGVYFYQLKAGSYVETKQMILIK